jgi:hypothetical protein
MMLEPAWKRVEAMIVIDSDERGPWLHISAISVPIHNQVDVVMFVPTGVCEIKMTSHRPGCDPWNIRPLRAHA